ncbi:MAG: fibrobacter succinogenes major paralogous domain-containing protein, partial [Bacteroidales bacterium]
DTLKYYYVFAYEGNDAIQAKQTAAYLTYGVLYNWQAAMTACPSGWHLPSDQEWTALSDFLGDQSGGKIKEAGYDHWDKPNTGATNESGFTAFAGGHRNYTGNFQDLWIDANFWTATADDAMHSWGRYIGYTFSGISRFNYLRNYGFSVRCVKDAGQ